MKRMKKDIEVVVAYLPDGKEKVFLDKSVDRVKELLSDIVPDGTKIVAENRVYLVDEELLVNHAKRVN